MNTSPINTLILATTVLVAVALQPGAARAGTTGGEEDLADESSAEEVGRDVPDVGGEGTTADPSAQSDVEAVPGAQRPSVVYVPRTRIIYVPFPQPPVPTGLGIGAIPRPNSIAPSRLRCIVRTIRFFDPYRGPILRAIRRCAPDRAGW